MRKIETTGLNAPESSQGTAPASSQANKPVIFTAAEVADYLTGNQGLISYAKATSIKAALDKAYEIIHIATGGFTGEALEHFAKSLTPMECDALQEVASGVSQIARREQMARDWMEDDGKAAETRAANQKRIREALFAPTAGNVTQREAVRRAVAKVFALLERPSFSLDDGELKRTAETGDACAAESLKALCSLAENGEEREHWASPMVNAERLPAVARAFLWPEKFSPADYGAVAVGFSLLDDKLTLEIETAGNLNGEKYLDGLIEVQSILGRLWDCIPAPGDADSASL